MLPNQITVCIIVHKTCLHFIMSSHLNKTIHLQACPGTVKIFNNAACINSVHKYIAELAGLNDCGNICFQIYAVLCVCCWGRASVLGVFPLRRCSQHAEEVPMRCSLPGGLTLSGKAVMNFLPYRFHSSTYAGIISSTSPRHREMPH